MHILEQLADKNDYQKQDKKEEVSDKKIWYDFYRRFDIENAEYIGH